MPQEAYTARSGTEEWYDLFGGQPVQGPTRPYVPYTEHMYAVCSEPAESYSTTATQKVYKPSSISPLGKEHDTGNSRRDNWEDNQTWAAPQIFLKKLLFSSLDQQKKFYFQSASSTKQSASSTTSQKMPQKNSQLTLNVPKEIHERQSSKNVKIN